MRYESVIKTWTLMSGSGASTAPKAPGPEWRVAGFSVGSDGHGAVAVIVYERELPSPARSAVFRGKLDELLEAEGAGVSKALEEAAFAVAHEAALRGATAAEIGAALAVAVVRASGFCLK